MRTDKTKVKRAPKRGHYDTKTIYNILDNDFICQIGFVYNGYPVVIPTIYGRKDDNLYFHGASVSRLLVTLEKGVPISLNVTQTDGIVLARSAFHHSLNYHSVTIFGEAELVMDEKERLDALKVVSDQIIPLRWEEARLPNKKELKATKVLKLKIKEASAKIRTGPPKDENEDYDLNIWAGVIPMNTTYGNPIVDPNLKSGILIPNSVKALIKKKG
ncbi:MAG: pyridoxamine 5'-phosphate oxidase family protein [Bacteroidia bacterium]|nr:pyridoxamine 5'-phosphate oxidase family protein [Bacteroidia bacterium]